ncbi:efflux RND transporter periplasmic adaptor subunit [Zavarzinia sp. CC-PAN008]|uniref:efflux RND transporter periplasmic adaptor subunit n=1 Tax=Zavarzinia sp. CC-PAN008 TaxID=3243332 RepID=UPI003F74719D
MSVATTAAWLAVLLALAVPAHAHEGHDHGETPPPITLPAAPRAEAMSDAFELVAVVRGDGLDLWLDRYADNAPVEGAVITVETPRGPVDAVAGQAGLYRVTAPWVAEPGAHDLIFTLMVAGQVDILAGTLVIPPTEPAAGGSASPWPQVPAAALAGAGFVAGLIVMALLRRRPAAAAMLLAALALLTPGPVQAQDQAQRLADGSVFVPKPTQHLLGIRTVLAASSTGARTVELPGRVIPDPDASGIVVSAVGGRLVPPPDGFPRLGAPVQAGQVLARVAPALQAIDTSDVQQQAGELEQQIAIVRRRLDRLRATPDAVPRARVEETELELAGLQERRRRLDRVRGGGEALTAPVDGVIAAASAVAGQMASPEAVIFRIADPARLWVEALGFEVMAPGTAATARLADGTVLALDWRGAGLWSAASQAVPVHFAVTNPPAGLRAGQLVTVLARIGDRTEGIAVPRAGVVRGANGQAQVWEHLGAERFVPREVRAEPLDAETMLVQAGLAPGQRIVVQGAELLNQVR